MNFKFDTESRRAAHFLQVLPLAPQPKTITTHTGQARHFPPAGFEPFLPPYVPPRGRWEWIPYPRPQPFFPEWVEGTWPSRPISAIGIDPAGPEFTVITVTTQADGSITIQ